MAIMADQHRNEVSSLLSAANISAMAPITTTTNQYASETQSIVLGLEQDLQELKTMHNNALQNSRSELEAQRKILASKINKI